MRSKFERLDIEIGRVEGLNSGSSNRVMTHDGGRASSATVTVRHGVSHQSPLNPGGHSRLNDTPLWITEGGSQRFEPEAMADPRGATQLANRVNRESLSYLASKESLQGTRQISLNSDALRQLRHDI